jgi:hypothetical protein
MYVFPPLRRWGKDKPENLIPGFTPMTEEQWEELRAILDRARSSAGMEWVWIDWCCIPQYSKDSNCLMVEIMRSKVRGGQGG